MRSWILLVVGLPALAQPAFEVASLRRVPPDRQGLTSLSPQGAASFTAASASLEVLISIAYGVPSDRISGLPSWVDSERYDVSAKPEGKGGMTYEQMQPMMQQLLTDRLHLAVHRGTKEVSGYALVVAKGGPRLKDSKAESGRAYILPEQMIFDHCAMDRFAWALSRPAGRPVIDATGISGNFDISLKYAREGDANSERPSLFTALQEQLGLKLEPRKVPLETIIVDHVDRVPAEN